MKMLLLLAIVVFTSSCASTSPESVARNQYMSNCLEEQGFWRIGPTRIQQLRIHNYCSAMAGASQGIASIESQ